MNKLYLIPDKTNTEQTFGLAKEYNCAFEYNDFYAAEVLDDSKRQADIIEYYSGYRKAFTKDKMHGAASSVSTNSPAGVFARDTMHGAFLDVTIHSRDPLIREASMLRVKQSMEIAKRMGVKGVVFHTGRLAGFRESVYLEYWKKTNMEFFTGLAQRYPGQQIYMENMFDEKPDILADFAESMRGVENFGICLDYAHAVISGCSGREWLETLAPYIRHMHINDNDLKNDLHQAVGSGSINWQEFDALVRKYGVDAPVLVEVNGCDAQKKSLEYMKQYGIYPMEKEGADLQA